MLQWVDSRAHIQLQTRRTMSDLQTLASDLEGEITEISTGEGKLT